MLPAKHTGAALVLLAEDTCVALCCLRSVPVPRGCGRVWGGRAVTSRAQQALFGGFALVSNLFCHFKTLLSLCRFVVLTVSFGFLSSAVDAFRTGCRCTDGSGFSLGSWSLALCRASVGFIFLWNHIIFFSFRSCFGSLTLYNAVLS